MNFMTRQICFLTIGTLMTIFQSSSSNACARIVRGNGHSLRLDTPECRNRALMKEAEDHADWDAQMKCPEGRTERKSDWNLRCEVFGGNYGNDYHYVPTASAQYSCLSDESAEQAERQ